LGADRSRPSLGVSSSPRLDLVAWAPAAPFANTKALMFQIIPVAAFGAIFTLEIWWILQ